MATVTITTTAPEDARIVVAFGKYLGLPGNANAAQIKAAAVAWMVEIVRNQEYRAQADAISVVPISPT